MGVAAGLPVGAGKEAQAFVHRMGEVRAGARQQQIVALAKAIAGQGQVTVEHRHEYPGLVGSKIKIVVAPHAGHQVTAQLGGLGLAALGDGLQMRADRLLGRRGRIEQQQGLELGLGTAIVAQCVIRPAQFQAGAGVIGIALQNALQGQRGFGRPAAIQRRAAQQVIVARLSRSLEFQGGQHAVGRSRLAARQQGFRLAQLVRPCARHRRRQRHYQ
nr:hypothetical protein [Chitinimonas arctica]